MPLIHNYDQQTGAYLGSNEARPNPRREGAYLIPGYATDVPLPIVPSGHVAVFDGEAWSSIQEDWRGIQLYRTDNGAPFFDPEFTGIGPKPAGTTEIPRPSAVHAWDGSGWAVDPVLDAAARVPATVTPLQARRALLAAGLLDAVETAIESADAETKLAWQYATAVERNSPFVATLAAALSLTSEQVDDLFVSAAAFV